MKEAKIPIPVDVKRKDHGETPLILASRYGKTKAVRQLLELGAQVNVCGKYNVTPLHSAACKGKLEIVKLLVQKKANVFAKTKYDDEEPDETPLDLARMRRTGLPAASSVTEEMRQYDAIIQLLEHQQKVEEAVEYVVDDRFPSID